MFWLMAKLLQGLSALVFIAVGLMYTLAVIGAANGRSSGFDSIPVQYDGEMSGLAAVFLIVVGWVMAAVMAGVIAFVGLGIEYFVVGIRSQR